MGIPGSIFQLIGDHSRFREASIQLTKDAKQGDLDEMVWAGIAVMIGLLNLYTDEKIRYSWITASEIIAKTQGRGMDHA